MFIFTNRYAYFILVLCSKTYRYLKEINHDYLDPRSQTVWYDIWFDNSELVSNDTYYLSSDQNPCDIPLNWLLNTDKHIHRQLHSMHKKYVAKTFLFCNVGAIRSRLNGYPLTVFNCKIRRMRFLQVWILVACFHYCSVAEERKMAEQSTRPIAALVVCIHPSWKWQFAQTCQFSQYWTDQIKSCRRTLQNGQSMRMRSLQATEL